MKPCSVQLKKGKKPLMPLILFQNIENLLAAYHKVHEIPKFRITNVNLQIMNTFQNAIASQLMQNQS